MIHELIYQDTRAFTSRHTILYTALHERIYEDTRAYTPCYTSLHITIYERIYRESASNLNGVLREKAKEQEASGSKRFLAFPATKEKSP